MIFKFFSSVDCKNTLQDNRAFLTFIQMIVDIFCLRNISSRLRYTTENEFNFILYESFLTMWLCVIFSNTKRCNKNWSINCNIISNEAISSQSITKLETLITQNKWQYHKRWCSSLSDGIIICSHDLVCICVCCRIIFYLSSMWYMVSALR